MLKCEPLWKRSETILSLSQNRICEGENYNKKIGKKFFFSIGIQQAKYIIVHADVLFPRCPLTTDLFPSYNFNDGEAPLTCCCFWFSFSIIPAYKYFIFHLFFFSQLIYILPMQDALKGTQKGYLKGKYFIGYSDCYTAECDETPSYVLNNLILQLLVFSESDLF